MTPSNYRSLGFEVFPCEGKVPARCSSWPNDEPFRNGDNIALVVPVGALVLDLDRKPNDPDEPNGIRALSKIMPKGWKHDGPRAATGGGGLHLWFRTMPLLGLGNGRGDLPAGIDVRGGGKGYVIAPPSWHPTTGVVYEWISPLVPVDELPELPEWLLARLLAPSTPAGPTAGRRSSALPERELSPYFEAALEAEAQAVRDAPVGSGNNTINVAAFNLGTLAAHGLSKGDAEAAIADALSEWTWANPRDEQAAWRTFESGWNSGERLPRAIPDDRATRSRARRSGAAPPTPTSQSGPAEPAPHRDPNDPGPEEPESADLASTPLIRIDTDEQRVNNEAVAALAGARYSDLYQRAAGLCRIVRVSSKPGDKLRLPENTTIIRPLSTATLRERLSASARWVKQGKESLIPAHPPQWSTLAVGDRGEYPGVPLLRGIASYPMLRPDGTVATREGYDPGTGYYLSGLPRDLRLRDTATQADAMAAAGRLLLLVQDFPFRNEVDRAAWLAYVLTPLARAVIDGPTPLFLVEANVRGSGKTLLADVASLVLTGRPLPAQTYPWNDEELEKVLVSVARLGLGVLCFDNVSTNLGGACLDKWLTSTTPTGRVLGSNDMPQFDWTTVLVATANNASISGDTDRRTIYVTLETEHERPELRDGFAIPDLPAHLRAHRADLLCDALAILQAHQQAGLPEQGGRPKGTFESWAHRVRDAVMFAGLPDCERAPDDEARPVDSDTDELATLLAGIWEHFAGQPVTVSELLDAAYPAGSEPRTTALGLREALAMMAGSRERPTRQRIGKRLAAYRNRWLNDLALNSTKDGKRKINVWRVISRQKAGSAGSSGKCGT